MAVPEGYRISGIEARMEVGARGEEKANVKKCIELTKKYCYITRTLEKVILIRISVMKMKLPNIAIVWRFFHNIVRRRMKVFHEG